MNRAVVLVAFVAAVSSSSSAAQPAAQRRLPQTATGCLTAFGAYKAVAANRTAFAHRCADSIVAHGVRRADVPTLAALYDSAQDPARARAYLLLRDIEVPMTAAAVGMRYSSDKPTLAALVTADSLAVRLDSLPDSVNDLKMLGHQKIVADAKAVNDRERTMHHARKVIELASRIRPHSKTLDAFIGYAADDLAQAFGDNGQADSALAVLDRARRDLGDARFTASGLGTLRRRYSLVGRPAPPIEAQHWFNADVHGPIAPARGKVTLIQFTGVTCAPCRASYPAMTALYTRFDRSQFDMLFVTTLAGEFDSKKMRPADELSATRDYYTKRYGFPFRIAVSDAPPASYVTASRYSMAGIPQFVIVDKAGAIRWIGLGWDSTSTTPLQKRITDLIAEP